MRHLPGLGRVDAEPAPAGLPDEAGKNPPEHVAPWYGPVSGRFPEWWTASAWKGMWNSPIQDIGGEFCACVSGNPYLFGMRGAPTLADMVIRKWRNARAAVAWYRDDVAAKAHADHYVAIDRNIVGPRAYHDGSCTQRACATSPSVRAWVR